MARVLVVDDHEGCRNVLVELVEAAGFEVVATADSGEAAVAAAVALAPDLAVLDVRMPGQGGRAAAGVIAALQPDTVVVLVSETPRSGGDVIAKSALTPALLRSIWRVRAPARPSHRLPVHEQGLPARSVQ